MIFDLDDTLYEERTFVMSGFDAVARSICQQTGKSYSKIIQTLIDDFTHNPRGKIFDRAFEKLGLPNKSAVSRAISIYRSHEPTINLLPGVRGVLEDLSSTGPIYLVTDGNKLVQSNKVKALDITNYFAGIYITHRFGRDAAKPSLTCFEKIKHKESADWNDLVYVGDDPNKDFVSLNKQGSNTIRVHQGRFKDFVATEGYDAKYHVASIPESRFIIDSLEIYPSKKKQY